jgi:hypothetical protein
MRLDIPKIGSDPVRQGGASPRALLIVSFWFIARLIYESLFTIRQNPTRARGGPIQFFFNPLRQKDFHHSLSSSSFLNFGIGFSFFVD